MPARADARGRKGYEEREFPQIEYMRRCADAAREVRGGALQEEGFADAELAQELRKRRVAAIAAIAAAAE